MASDFIPACSVHLSLPIQECFAIGAQFDHNLLKLVVRKVYFDRVDALEQPCLAREQRAIWPWIRRT